MRRRVLLGGVLGALFALGWWVGGTRAASGLYTGLDLFVEVLETVQANYVDAVDTGKLVTGAMRGVAHGLDPWSRYLDPDEYGEVSLAAIVTMTANTVSNCGLSQYIVSKPRAGRAAQTPAASGSARTSITT